MSKIKIEQDQETEMMKITFDKKVIFEGNYWDFDGSPSRIVSFLKKLKLDVDLKEYVFKG